VRSALLISGVPDAIHEDNVLGRNIYTMNCLQDLKEALQMIWDVWNCFVAWNRNFTFPSSKNLHSSTLHRQERGKHKTTPFPASKGLVFAMAPQLAMKKRLPSKYKQFIHRRILTEGPTGRRLDSIIFSFSPDDNFV
jgi:hypothetical protein